MDVGFLQIVHFGLLVYILHRGGDANLKPRNFYNDAIIMILLKPYKAYNNYDIIMCQILSISPSIQDVWELHALSLPSACQYSLGST